ncbi:coiled-coil domain-containing protein, partial [Streptomyces sp. NPDC059378]|uniref:coiled-coil domain-containing protein n=1 Tax=Streptomyces sp. NPDC059378 TaxID=3346815 RepID=UPI00369F1033
MAAHRKPRPRSLSGNTVRTAATLALAGAATATVFDGTGHAEPNLTPGQVRAKVDKLYQEAEAATQKYDGAHEKAQAAEKRLGTLRDEAARREDRLNSARDALGSIAAAQYRAGGMDPALQLALSDDPDRYLEGAAFAERAGDRQAGAVARVRGQLREIEQLRGAARLQLTSLKARQAELRREKRTITGKLAAARQLLARLPAAERAQARGDGGSTARASAGAGGARGPLPGPGAPPAARPRGRRGARPP